jgi:hypothetical protein
MSMVMRTSCIDLNPALKHGDRYGKGLVQAARTMP